MTLHKLVRRNHGGKSPVSIKYQNLHSFKEGLILLCQSIFETRRITHLHGSTHFIYNPFKTVLVEIESKVFFVAQSWWATFKISFAVIFVGKTQIIFEKLNRTPPQAHFHIKFHI